MEAWSRPEVPALVPEAGRRAVPDADADDVRPRLFDTATGTLLPVGQTSGTARLYVCGITPYDATHLGHANTYVAFDLLNRTWLDAGLAVTYTQNVTDVDDPLLERAARTGVDWRQLAAEQTDLFRRDMEALRVLPPDHYVGAVESIPLAVELVQRLERTGLVYRVDDAEHPDWYFSCRRSPGFGSRSGVDIAAAVALFAERGGDPERPGKRDPLDCLVWRMAREGEPSWPSDLGEGRPGWHVECAAIALRHLGEEFDVQGGGSDLAFPHHEMCAAEATAATGRPFARAYVHSGMVGYEGEKMSKSKGNLVLVSHLLHQGADPMAIRLLLLAHHYRDDWEYTDADLIRARERLEAWRGMMNELSALPAGDVVAEIRTALRDDLDAPRALAAIDGWVASSSAIESDDTAAPGLVQAAADALLGVDLRPAR